MIVYRPLRSFMAFLNMAFGFFCNSILLLSSFVHFFCVLQSFLCSLLRCGVLVVGSAGCLFLDFFWHFWSLSNFGWCWSFWIFWIYAGDLFHNSVLFLLSTFILLCFLHGFLRCCLCLRIVGVWSCTCFLKGFFGTGYLLGYLWSINL